MHTLHEHVVGAQDRLATLVRATVDDHILADDVHVAHDDLRVGTLEIEILRQGSDDGALVDLVAVAHACAVED